MICLGHVKQRLICTPDFEHLLATSWVEYKQLTYNNNVGEVPNVAVLLTRKQSGPEKNYLHPERLAKRFELSRRRNVRRGFWCRRYSLRASAKAQNVGGPIWVKSCKVLISDLSQPCLFQTRFISFLRGKEHFVCPSSVLFPREKASERAICETREGVCTLPTACVCHRGSSLDKRAPDGPIWRTYASKLHE